MFQLFFGCFPNEISMKDSQTHYDHLAKVYDTLYPVRSNVVDFIVHRIKKLLQVGQFGKIVDLGCGTGLLLKQLGNHLPFPDLLVGVDQSKEMVLHAKDKGLQALCAPFEAVPLRFQSVQLAIFKESIHHANFPQLLEHLNYFMNPLGEVLVFYQNDWDIRPAPDTFKTWIDQARSKRAGSDFIIKQLETGGWMLKEHEHLQGELPIQPSFVELAIQHNALSYWAAFEQEERNTVLEEAKGFYTNKEVFLYRDLEALVFKQVH